MKINVRWFTFRLHIFEPKLSWALLHLFNMLFSGFVPFTSFFAIKDLRNKHDMTFNVHILHILWSRLSLQAVQRGCRGRSHSCTPHTASVLACRACVCRGCMASRVFVCTRLQSVNAAFSSSAPLQTVYGGIPVRLSVAQSMPSLGRWPNSFCTQWLTLHVTMRVRGGGEEKKYYSERQVAFVILICKLLLVHARAPPPTNIPQSQDLKISDHDLKPFLTSLTFKFIQI